MVVAPDYWPNQELLKEQWHESMLKAGGPVGPRLWTRVGVSECLFPPGDCPLPQSAAVSTLLINQGGVKEIRRTPCKGEKQYGGGGLLATVYCPAIESGYCPPNECWHP